MKNNHLTDTKFADFPLEPEILQSLNDANFEYCTPIQAEILPKTLEGKDVAGQAQTGTGKTGAFLVSLFQYLLKNPIEKPFKNSVRCLCLAPTRELAIQIAKDAETLGKHTGLNIALVYGGAGYDAQRRQFEKPVDLLIGTPGRAIDYWKQRAYTLKQAQAMILDEADRMFDMGFIKDIRYLLRKLPDPDQRLNMLFSATLSMRVMELSYEHMNSPERVVIKSDKVNSDSIKQTVFYPANSEKISLLVGLLQKHTPFRSIIFVNTKHDAETIENYLKGNDIKAAMISGDVRQNKRQKLLKDFQDSKYHVLIATDVAARGLHIPDVTHVFNYSLPQIAEDYVHRIGRTARAGASGEAFSFACEDSAFYLPDIEKYIGTRIPMEQVDPELLAELKKPVYVKRSRPKTHNKKNQNNKRGQRPPKKSWKKPYRKRQPQNNSNKPKE